MANLSCQLCYFGTQSQEVLFRHIVKYHKNDPGLKIECNENGCGKTFAKWKSYKRHVQRNHSSCDIIDDVICADNVDAEDIASLRDEENHVSMAEHFEVLQAQFLIKIRDYHKVSDTAISQIIDGVRDVVTNFSSMIVDDTRIMKVGDKKRWIHDPNSELCRPLNCKKKELCLLEDTFTAVCVSKKELHKAGDIVIPKSRAVQQRRMRAETSVDGEDDDAFFDSEDDDEDQDESKCVECPVVKPSFLCGNDNRTYSSPCRLEYHNCIHHTSVHIACKGFCPCKVVVLHSKKAQMQKQKSLLGKISRNRDITLTPRDFNYDNHHYQYLKYSKRGKTAAGGLNRYDDKHLMSNEIEKNPSTLKSTFNPQSPSRNAECPPSSKPAMANRLLDWFSVVMSDAKYRRQHVKSKGHFPAGCQTEVRWMFGHLDNDGDRRISLSELYSLEHDQNEPCLKPFLDACDIDGDIFVSGAEWCECFSKAERPCAAVRRRSSPDFAPSCDSRGYYRSTQCHRGLGLCWCVDPHGVEFAGTRTRGAKPDCDAIVNKISSGGLKTNSVDLDDDDEDSDQETAQDLEGSADQPLDF